MAHYPLLTCHLSRWRTAQIAIGIKTVVLMVLTASVASLNFQAHKLTNSIYSQSGKLTLHNKSGKASPK